jgi:hypothetical protein
MEMIMTVLVLCMPFFVLPLFVFPFFLCLGSVPFLFFLAAKICRKFSGAIFLTQNKKPTRLRVGWNFFFIALTTNSPLASYLGGTQNRNEYEQARIMVA